MGLWSETVVVSRDREGDLDSGVLAASDVYFRFVLEEVFCESRLGYRAAWRGGDEAKTLDFIRLKRSVPLSRRLPESRLG